MNKLILISLSVFILSISSSLNIKSEFNIVGIWEWDQYASCGKMEFHENGKVNIKLERERINGKLELVKDQEISLEYKLDYKKSPITLDLIAKKPNNDSILIRPCIIDIIDNNTIIFVPSDNGKRPQKITDSDYRMILNRIK
jgi:hypothetical protein